MLGLALTVTAGPFALDAPGASSAGVPGTQDTDLGADDGTLDRCDCDAGPDTITIGLAVRWGYLDDAAAFGLEGRWRWNEDRTGGGFAGLWRQREGERNGSFHGRFALGDDGHGRFHGEWNFSTGRDGGFLSGAWVRVDRAHGVFDGRWNFTDGRPGGVLAGAWAVLSEQGGTLRGRAIHVPSMDPVDWDGFLQVSGGAVELKRTVRWETGGDRRHGTDDQVLRRHDRALVEWLSTTTVDWDGLVFAIRVPRERPIANVTLHTDQIEFTWSAREIPGLHVRQPVDRLGHEIEVRGFLLERHDGRDLARIGVGLRWGHLDTRGEDRDGDAKAWDGGARISAGGMGVGMVLSFERGDRVLPREDRQVVRWESRTTTGWDGLILWALVPLHEVENATFSLRAGGFEHTWTLPELAGHHVFPFDDGTALEVRAIRG
jgi:hypothetical protein